MPSDATVAVLASRRQCSTVEASVTCRVKRLSPFAASPVAVQVTTWPEAEQSLDGRRWWYVSADGSVSLTVKPPVLSDGPLLSTVSV